MPRIARVVATGLPHHITQRGNRHADVFLDDEDRLKYLELLKQYRQRHGMEILAYCLMANHIHLVVIPREAHSLARTLAETHMRYAQHINWKHRQTGHLWQGRFYSCVLDEPHTLAAARYVERNPVRAGLVSRPWDYPWSSARAHVGDAKDALVSKRWPSGQLLTQWRGILSEPDGDSETNSIRSSTRTGRPLGSGMFIEMVERMISRFVKLKKRGRPRKNSIKQAL
jgi:putative transposase